MNRFRLPLFDVRKDGSCGIEAIPAEKKRDTTFPAFQAAKLPKVHILMI